jgi:inosine/xanthosine triphosphatase
MHIAIGSTNTVKVSALTELIPEYPLLAGAEVHTVRTESGVRDQPQSLDETIQGAKHRAEHAFQGSGLGFGIESGLMDVPHTNTGVMDVTVCAIYDGTKYYLGLSSALECPPKAIDLVRTANMDLSQAFNHAGFTQEENIGSSQGFLGLLTNGRIDRKAYTKQAIIMALVQLEHAPWYQNA